MKKKFEDMSAKELTDMMNKISEYCSNSIIENGYSKCADCPLTEHCGPMDEPDRWDVYRFIALVKTYIDEVE